MCIRDRRKDAEAHAEDDKKRRDEIEQRNEADNAVYRSEKMLKDNAAKISAEQKEKIEEAVKEVKEAIKGGDASVIRSANEKLNEAWQSVSAELYKAAAEKARAGKAQGQPGPEAGGEAKSEDKKEMCIRDRNYSDRGSNSGDGFKRIETAFSPAGEMCIRDSCTALRRLEA